MTSRSESVPKNPQLLLSLPSPTLVYNFYMSIPILTSYETIQEVMSCRAPHLCDLWQWDRSLGGYSLDRHDWSWTGSADLIIYCGTSKWPLFGRNSHWKYVNLMLIFCLRTRFLTNCRKSHLLSYAENVSVAEMIG